MAEPARDGVHGRRLPHRRHPARVRPRRPSSARDCRSISFDWFTKDIPDVASSTLASKFGATDVAAGRLRHGAGHRRHAARRRGWPRCLAVPLGILGAIYLNEYGRTGRFARVLRFTTDVMIGVPSVIMGIFLYAVWVVPRGTTGRSAVAGALALACIMLPIVVRSTEEMLKLVPDNLREASLALGSSTSRTTLTVVLPAAHRRDHQRLHARRRSSGGRDRAAPAYDRLDPLPQRPVLRGEHRACRPRSTRMSPNPAANPWHGAPHSHSSSWCCCSPCWRGS